MSHDHDDAHEGLQQDLTTLAIRAHRRDFLRWVAGASAIPFIAPLAACLGGNDVGAVDDSTTTDGSTGTCSTIPEETAGPYPGDGTNGPNALTSSGIVRSDITSSFGSYSGTAAGVPLTIKLVLVDSDNNCTPLEGYAVYLWHCDAAGRYSLYSSGVTTQNYLRGVQEVDATGMVTFVSIFPACYDGRWPHIHFEVYPSTAVATNGSAKIATSQMAMPKATCDVVYATSNYASSATNLAKVSLGTDNVFSDGTSLQIPTITGNATDGYVATLTIGVTG
ncbi:MAG TPA: intradiol ring-cleavage dioxygenase [Kofleriaceae bacterium]|jgi:protocatechuate 3,4-dioxygenase beta subunit